MVGPRYGYSLRRTLHRVRFHLALVDCRVAGRTFRRPDGFLHLIDLDEVLFLSFFRHLVSRHRVFQVARRREQDAFAEVIGCTTESRLTPQRNVENAGA